MKKMSLKSIEGVLSRDEMSKIMAGSSGGYCGQCFISGSSGGSSAACTRNEVMGCWCPNGAPCWVEKLIKKISIYTKTSVLPILGKTVKSIPWNQFV